MFKLLTAIPDLIKGVFGFGEKTLDYFIKKSDNDLQKGLAAYTTYQSLIAAQRDVTLAAMSHPMWWIGWALFILPPGAYHALIFFVSMFDMWLNTPGCHVWAIGEAVPRGVKLCEWYVRKVPPDQQQLSMLAAGLFVGLQVGSGIIAGILTRITGK